MKKRVLGLLIMLALVLTVVPLFGVIAYAEEPAKVAKIIETGIEYSTVQAAINAAGDDQTVQMIANSKENVTVSQNGDVYSIILDLNGHVLQGTGSGSVIDNAINLTLKDSNASEVSPRVHYFNYVENGAWTYYGDTAPETGKIDTIDAIDADTKYVKVFGGVITGGNADYGGGVLNKKSDEAGLTMESGSIIGCKTTIDSASLNPTYYGGGGICNYGTLNMSGGTS